MSPNFMQLKILLPSRVYLEKSLVTRIIAETPKGFFGILPRRRDCSAILVPGMLIYETQAEEESYVAVDEGVLVKTGEQVQISVRNAIAGKSLASLRQTVQQEFLVRNEMEKKFRTTLARLESHFVRHFLEVSRNV